MTTLDVCHNKRKNEYNVRREKVNADQRMNEIEKEMELRKIDREEIVYFSSIMDLLIDYYAKHKFVKSKTKETHRNALTKFITKKHNVDKEELFSEYMFRLYGDPSHKKCETDTQKKKCMTCDKIKVLDSASSTYVCEQCGLSEPFTGDFGQAPYINEPFIECNSFTYKRYDHFVDWLDRIHNKKRAIVPKKVCALVEEEINKIRAHDRNFEPTKETVLEILKKTGNSKYNSKIFFILNVVVNKPMPKIPREVQEKMKIMFKKTQSPFEKCRPPGRTNFLSYSYVIRKFLELLEQPQYAGYFPLLKSKEKLYAQDQIWKNICLQLNWKYVPSI